MVDWAREWHTHCMLRASLENIQWKQDLRIVHYYRVATTIAIHTIWSARAVSQCSSTGNRSATCCILTDSGIRNLLIATKLLKQDLIASDSSA